jgi:hypothetical protein
LLFSGQGVSSNQIVFSLLTADVMPMTKLLFIAQDSLEGLIAQGKVQLDGFRLSLTGSMTSYNVDPAAKVLSCEGSSGDPLSINGKIISLKVLNDKGAVIYLNSITIGVHSYLIDQGYICYKTNE